MHTQFPLAVERADDLRSRAALGNLLHRWVLTHLSFFDELLQGDPGYEEWSSVAFDPLSSVFWSSMRELPVYPISFECFPLPCVVHLQLHPFPFINQNL